MRVWSHPLRVVVLLIWAVVLVMGGITGIAATPAARIAQIYVTARGAILRMKDMTGAVLAVLGPTGTWIDQFVTSSGIFVDGMGRIYMADSASGRVVRMDDMTGAGWTPPIPFIFA